MAYPIEIPELDDFPEDAVVDYCRSPNRRTIAEGAKEVVRINADLVVKFGYGVSIAEADNQEFAWASLDESIVRVPEPVYFFMADGDGYFVMKWLDFRPVTAEDVEAVARAVTHMHSLPCGAVDPGPVSGGPCQERFEEDVEFEDKQDLENFLNDRLLGKGPRFSLHHEDLVLTHLDIAPRNLGILLDGTVCLLDWELAGFFPRWFDNAMLQACDDIQPGSNQFKALLVAAMEAMAPLTETELDHKDSLKLVVWNCVGKYFRPWNASPLPPDYSPPPRKKKILDTSSLPYVGVPINQPIDATPCIDWD